MTLAELLERYALLMGLSDRSVVLYGHTISKFAQFLEREPQVADLEDVTVAKFLRWRAGNVRSGKPVSPQTVSKDRSQLLALWNWSCRKKLHPGEWPGLPRQKKVRKTPVAYTSHDIEAMIIAARRRRGDAAWWWSTLIQTAWQTGERIGAMLSLRWGDVDANRRLVTFRAETRKGGIADNVQPITAALAEELDTKRGQPDALVWPRTGHPLSIYPSLRLVCKAAGVTPRGFHGIRRASASYVAAGGGDATSHLGHADPAMTRNHYLDTRITQRTHGLDYLPPLDLGGPGKPR